ncbi:MAG: pyridoxal 5'-phosphate synthase glutaminase subunit PdxT, partial [Methanomassiliicoccales archaeon]
KAVDGLIIPGGESTTISKLMVKAGMDEIIRERASDGLPIMGTCAGCILLAKEGDKEVEESETIILGLMDMKVERNAFGRQRESFETTLSIAGFENPYEAVFIRAPTVEEVWGGCRALARLEGRIVMAKQRNLMAVSFHPELTNDMRVHKLLLNMILNPDFEP